MTKPETDPSGGPDIAGRRLADADYARNFADVHPPLAPAAALVEANRCYFCYDAPCIEACPTEIDIPGFIRKIKTGNVAGAAKTILEQNIFGGACARVCPTEVLCEQACVRTTQENTPVTIGLLQRFATDHLMAKGDQPFERAPATGKKVAVVGGGPAGLACAHRLAVLGHDSVVFEAREKAAGLNEYGIAAYKVPDDFAQAELDFIIGIGGIEIRCGQALGRDVTLGELQQDFDAVFLGLGQAGVRALGRAGEDLGGVHNAVDYIVDLRQADDLASLPVGRRVVVIGGGNTAIDIAVQSKRLGAEDVTMVYRRGPGQMGATPHEQEFAQTNGVKIRHWAQPVRLEGVDGHVATAVFEYTRANDGGKLVGTGDLLAVPCDVVFKAIGQQFAPVCSEDALEVAKGRIAVDAEMRTSMPNVWAGGDCVAGEDLTVQAVQDGKVAAQSIDRYLRG